MGRKSLSVMLALGRCQYLTKKLEGRIYEGAEEFSRRHASASSIGL